MIQTGLTTKVKERGETCERKTVHIRGMDATTKEEEVKEAIGKKSGTLQEGIQNRAV